MEFEKLFIVTDKLRVLARGEQLNTYLAIESDGQTIQLNVDKWTEFKKSMNAIDVEFMRRFNYQYPPSGPLPDEGEVRTDFYYNLLRFFILCYVIVGRVARSICVNVDR